MLRPGGIFVNADYMPDHGLPAFSKRLLARADARRDAPVRGRCGALLAGLVEHFATQEVLRPLVAA
ncbi:MAG TPA: hypothetical protein VFH03_11980 [Actinoplanes sp.]|nr:hypothetical protein [Actinoplanes sp.]